MKITVVGCGSAFSNINYNQCFLLEEVYNNQTRKLLFDCGQQIIPAGLNNANIDIKDIDDIYISHEHADHCASLEAVAFQRFDWLENPKTINGFKNCKPVTLYGERQLLRNLWNNTLYGGLKHMTGFVSTIDTFFDVKSIDSYFEWQGWKCELVKQEHIISDKDNICYSYGLIMSKADKSVYITSDSRYISTEQVKTCYDTADMILQDCETYDRCSGAHANYSELKGSTADIRKKMYLSHYSDDVDIDWFERAKNDGFGGFIKVGQKFNI